MWFMLLWPIFMWGGGKMKKVRSSKDMKVKRKMDASRPSVKSGVYSSPKPIKTVLPSKVSSKLDDEYTIEQIRLE